MRRLLYRLGLVQLVWYWWYNEWCLRIVRRNKTGLLYVYRYTNDEKFYLEDKENKFLAYVPGKNPNKVYGRVTKDEVVKVLVEKELRNK